MNDVTFLNMSRILKGLRMEEENKTVFRSRFKVGMTAIYGIYKNRDRIRPVGIKAKGRIEDKYREVFPHKTLVPEAMPKAQRLFAASS